MKNLQTMKQNVQKGFTLIELMIVVAIIGILAAIAIPAYTDYTIKSRIAEGASLMGKSKTALEVYWSENGTLLAPGGGDLTLANIDIDNALAAAEYVSSIYIDTVSSLPIFVIEYRDSTALGIASGSCVEYRPVAVAGQNIRWEVRSATTYDTAAGNTIAAAQCTPGSDQF